MPVMVAPTAAAPRWAPASAWPATSVPRSDARATSCADFAISPTDRHVSAIRRACTSVPRTSRPAEARISSEAAPTCPVARFTSPMIRRSSPIMKLKESAMGPVMSFVTSASLVRSPSATPLISRSSLRIAS